jgi:hypothetical protein
MQGMPQRTQWHVMRSHEGRSRDGVLVVGVPGWSRTPSLGLLGTVLHQGTRDYIGRRISSVDRSLVLNLNSISYILVTTQYFRTSLGDTHWTYQGSLPKTP